MAIGMTRQTRHKLDKLDKLDKLALLRLCMTPLLFLTRGSLWMTALALLLIDIVDCPNFLYRGALHCTGNATYQLRDKVTDVAQYAAAVAVLSWPGAGGGVPASAARTLTALLAWRAVGVALLMVLGDTRVLVPFVDAVKEVMLLYGLVSSTPAAAVVGGVVACKVVFEVVKNGGVMADPILPA
jgi:hypothetical protein